MIVYLNNENLMNNITYDIDYDNHLEEKYIFSTKGIYKKYKHHYFEMDDSDIIYEKYIYDNNIEIFVQNILPKINKKKILTNIDIDSYDVTRNKYEKNINDNVILVKEVDNTKYLNIYFKIQNIELIDALEIIQTYCNKL